MVDRRREQAVNQAAARFPETLAESYRSSTSRPRKPEGARGSSPRRTPRRVMDHLKGQTESGRAASEQLAEQKKLVQESVVPATVFPT